MTALLMALTIKRNLLLNDPTGGRGRLVSQPGVIINKKSFSRKRFFSSRKWTNRTQFLFSKSNFRVANSMRVFYTERHPLSARTQVLRDGKAKYLGQPARDRRTERLQLCITTT
ncbi:MAG: hypothetical protein KKD24_02800 [Proteobacteria bacterium]|nr:hypothetical protein [Pseudomonadota bacterium]